jgi:hypothetical protein
VFGSTPSQKGLGPNCRKPIGRLKIPSSSNFHSFAMKLAQVLNSMSIYFIIFFNSFYLEAKPTIHGDLLEPQPKSTP